MRRHAAGTWCALLVVSCGNGERDVVTAAGTIEVHEADLAAPAPATVLRILVDEGDAVAEGDTVALLLQRDLDATIASAQARWRTAIATLRDLEAGARPQELERARADLQAAEAEVARTAAEQHRAKELLDSGLGTQQVFDNADAAARTAISRRDAARETLRLLEAGARSHQIAAARAEASSAEATLRAIETRQADLVLTAPFAGTVLHRLAEPGEVLGAGVPAVTIGLTGRPWVRVYLRRDVVARLRTGAPATILLAGREIPGRITSFSPQAEFTPRVALTETERADLLFGVKVEPVEDTVSVLRPGLWVDVRIRLAGAP